MDLQELDIKDQRDINGGGLVVLALAAFFGGRRVEYVKDGGGFFDYYL